MQQTLLFLGHGGGAQSAVAIATAFHAAALGRRTLLASTGPMHRIGSLLGRHLTPKASELTPNLFATEAAPMAELEHSWTDLLRETRGLLAGRLREIRADEVPMVPSIDELGGIRSIERLRNAGKFELVVIDGPALPQMLRSLSLPDAYRWILRQMIGIDRGPGRSRASQDAALLPGGLVPQALTAPLQDLRVYMEELRTIFEAHSNTAVRLVLPANDLKLPAMRQALGALGLYNLMVDALIAETTDEALLSELTPSLAPRKVLPWPGQIDGDWAAQGLALYGDHLPDEAFVAPVATGPIENEFVIHIPFLEAGSIDIADIGDEAIVQFGAYRRHMLLPPPLRNRALRARVDGELLRLWAEAEG